MTDDHGKAQKHFDLIELDKRIENEHTKGQNYEDRYQTSNKKDAIVAKKQGL